MTKEQKIFLNGKRALSILDETKKERPLTEREKANEEEIKTLLLNTVIRFGMAEAHKRMERYRLDRDAYQDVYQSLCLMFFEKLPSYDPGFSTPTTFFVSYFDQVISDYLHSYSQRRTPYDAANISILRAAIRDFEQKGVKWNDEMLVAATGMSLKVVRQTLLLAHNSIYADVEEQIISSKEPTPEEACLREERERTIYSAIRNSLSDDEIDFFMYKVNLDGKKERSIKDVAERFGIPQRTAKKSWSSILSRLQGVQDLRQYRASGPEVDATVSYSPTSEEEAVGRMESAAAAMSGIRVSAAG